MEESILFKFSLFFSILGIVIIYLISVNIEINDTTIEKITSGQTQETISIKGVVQKITRTENAVFLTIKQDSQIEVIAFSDIDSLQEGDTVNLIGKITEYKGKKEIFAEKIEKIN